MVWAKACQRAHSFDVDKVRQATYGLGYAAPGGPIKMAHNQMTYRPVYIGQIMSDGQFKIVWHSQGLVKPEAYSPYLHPDGNFPAPTGGPKGM